jgi:hypothetical protein
MARRERRLTKRERKAADARSPGFDDRIRTLAAKHGMPEERLHFGGVADRPKMSDVLKKWAAPILETLRGDIGAFTNGVRFAATLWNAATVMLDRPEVVADRLMEAVGAAGVPYLGDMHGLLVDLIASRREEYGLDTRIVIETEVIDGGHEYRISVASAVPGERPTQT